MRTCENFSYMMLNLVDEVGELASKVAKDIRKGNVVIGQVDNDLVPLMPFDEWISRDEELRLEAGDILWQLSGLCSAMGWDLEEIAQANLDKLASRKARGKIEGNGDYR